MQGNFDIVQQVAHSTAVYELHDDKGFGIITEIKNGHYVGMVKPHHCMRKQCHHLPTVYMDPT